MSLTLGEFRSLTAHLDGDRELLCAGASVGILWHDEDDCVSIDDAHWLDLDGQDATVLHGSLAADEDDADVDAVRKVETTSSYRTFAAARRAGLRTATELSCISHRRGTPPCYPKRGVKPIVVKGVEFFAREDCELIVSRSDVKRWHGRLRAGAEPVVMLHGTRGKYPGYRLSDCVVPQESAWMVPSLDRLPTIGEPAQLVVPASGVASDAARRTNT